MSFGDAFTEFDDGSAELVADDERWLNAGGRPAVPRVYVEVGAANGSRFKLDLDLARASVGLVGLNDFDTGPRTRLCDCFHRGERVPAPEDRWARRVFMCTLMCMKNVTLSMPEDLLEKSRAYAKARGTTLNQMMRDMLQRELDREGRSRFLELIAKAKEQGQASDGPYLTREEAHER